MTYFRRNSPLAAEGISPPLTDGELIWQGLHAWYLYRCRNLIGLSDFLGIRCKKFLTAIHGMNDFTQPKSPMTNFITSENPSTDW